MKRLMLYNVVKARMFYVILYYLSMEKFYCVQRSPKKIYCELKNNCLFLDFNSFIVPKSFFFLFFCFFFF